MTTIQTATMKQNKFKKLFSLNYKQIIKFSLGKLTENLGEVAMTAVTAAITISAVSIVAPLAAEEYSGYIVLVFLLIQLRRLVQDFDESWTNDEIAELLTKMDQELMGVYRMVRDETILTAADESLEALINA